MRKEPRLILALIPNPFDVTKKHRKYAIYENLLTSASILSTLGEIGKIVLRIIINND